MKMSKENVSSFLSSNNFVPTTIFNTKLLMVVTLTCQIKTNENTIKSKCDIK